MAHSHGASWLSSSQILSGCAQLSPRMSNPRENKVEASFFPPECWKMQHCPVLLIIQCSPILCGGDCTGRKYQDTRSLGAILRVGYHSKYSVNYSCHYYHCYYYFHHQIYKYTCISSHLSPSATQALSLLSKGSLFIFLPQTFCYRSYSIVFIQLQTHYLPCFFSSAFKFAHIFPILVKLFNNTFPCEYHISPFPLRATSEKSYVYLPLCISSFPTHSLTGSSMSSGASRNLNSFC